MTKIEALNVIHSLSFDKDEHSALAHQMAAEALNNTIPVYVHRCKCPVCTTWVMLGDKFCYNCGQALKWYRNEKVS